MNLFAALLLAFAQVKYPARPAQGEFILDEAKILKDGDAAEIRRVCGEVLAAKRAPIVVVTIKSMAEYGATGWPIQRYAMNLFSEWAVGWSDWNYGMLLLVSTGDKKARIELGASWGHLKDPDAQKVMNDEIVPRFKRGEFSGGILAGVKGLRDIATADIQGTPVPQVYGPAPVTKPATPVYTPRPVPYQQIQRSHGVPASGTNWATILIVVVVVMVGLMIVVAVLRAATSSWGGDPGASAFAGGCLGSSMGGWFGGGPGWGYHRYGYYSDPWDRPWGWGWGGGWFGGGHTDHHYYHHYDSGPSYDSSSSSSSSSGSSSGWSDSGGGGSSDSSSSGGGFSGGGGASGEW